MLPIALIALLAQPCVASWREELERVLAASEAQRPTPVTREEERPPPHPLVTRFVQYFQTAGAARFQAGLRRLETWRPMIEATFARHNLPKSLLWVGLVESGYDPNARSPRNAAGMWQFIPETGARFGLTDGERTDPVKSTQAAARYLKFLYTKFGDWPLVLAAYNAGERRVEDAIARGGTRDFWRLAAHGLLPRETQAYVPAILAAQEFGEGSPDENRIQSDRTGGAEAHVVYAPFRVTP